jgi:hypothetical protein
VIVPCWSRERERPARNHHDVSSGWAHTALPHRICTRIGRRKLGKLIEELAGPWLAQQESRLRDRRGRDRLRAEGAGPDHELALTGRVIATLVTMRFQLPPAALAVFYGVHRSTITRAAPSWLMILGSGQTRRCDLRVLGSGELILRTNPGS